MNETATTVYTKEYFIEKLSAIPDENWLSDGYLFDKNNSKKGCLLHHLGVKEDFKPSAEASALVKMIDENLDRLALTIPVCHLIKEKYDELLDGDDDKLTLAYTINDTSVRKFHMTPKQAILNCLEAL